MSTFYPIMRLIAINYLTKIKHIFESAENKLLAFFSTLLGVVMLFLIERKSTSPQIIIFENTAVFYALLLLLFLLICAVIFLTKKPSFIFFIKKLTVCLLPTEIALVIGLFFANQATYAHIFFYLFAFLYPATIFLYYIWKRKDYLPFQTGGFASVRNWLSKQGLFFLSALLIVVAINVFLVAKDIGNFAAVDEPLWTFDRVPGYWKNALEGDFGNTAISDKPGITVALLSGIGLLDVNPKAYESNGSQRSDLDIVEMNRALRLPLAIFCSLCLFVFYFLINNLFGKKVALLATAAIAFSPPLIGMSRIINPDALLWVFAPLSILAYLAFLQKRRRAYLLAAGFLLGLSLLTKYVANIITVFLVLSSFCELFTSQTEHANKGGNGFVKEKVKGALGDIASVFAISLVTFYVFYPATWLAPGKLLSATLASQAFISTAPYFLLVLALLLFDTFVLRSFAMEKLAFFITKNKRFLPTALPLLFIIFTLFVFFDTYFGMKPFDFQEILASPKTSFLTTKIFGLFTANFYPLVFTTAPLVLFGAFFALLQEAKNKKTGSNHSLLILYFASFILLYYFATTINGVAATIRYQIMIFPFFLILGAIGLVAIINRVRSKYAYQVAFALISASLLSTALTAAPHYLAYASSLLPNKYIVDVKDMGDGSYEIAQYLNSLPDADALFVWSDKKGVCNFFVGKCDSFTGSDEFNAVKIDYFVISSGRKSRSLNMLSSRASNPYDFPKIYNSTDFVNQLIIGGRPADYIRVLKAGDYFKNR